MEFLNISVTKMRVFCSHSIYSLSTGGFFKKTMQTLLWFSKYIQKNPRNKFIHEQHFTEKKNEGRKPDKDLSLRRLQFMPAKTLTKNAVQEFHLWDSPRHCVQTFLCTCLTAAITSRKHVSELIHEYVKGSSMEDGPWILLYMLQCMYYILRGLIGQRGLEGCTAHNF